MYGGLKGEKRLESTLGVGRDVGGKVKILPIFPSSDFDYQPSLRNIS